jgi:hypothetical protein
MTYTLQKMMRTLLKHLQFSVEWVSITHTCEYTSFVCLNLEKYIVSVGLIK